MKDKNYRVGIIGLGVVGKCIQRLFKEDVVAIYDPLVKTFKEEFKYLDIAIICVPTNSKNDGSCDTSIVEESVDWVYKINPNVVILIKSAIIPSEVQRIRKKYKNIRLVLSPEFSGESKYFTPFWKYPDPNNMESHTWQVFGGDKKDTTMCVDIFKRRMGVDTQFWQTDMITASLSKYIENDFFATKVTFCNEWYDIAKAYGVDWNELRELWLLDPRINRNHTLVFPKDRGYGGKCFPKDVKAIIKESEKLGFSADLLKSVDKINERYRKGEY
jgi:UDPglucose 6-dehydrogenase